MSRHVFKKGVAYFRKNGFRKACKRTVYFFTERNSYKKLLAHTQSSVQELERQRNERFGYEPKVSILIPMYNTPLEFFKELISCVKEQTYANWELCLADGTGKDTESSAYASECMKSDARIVYRRLDSNDGISENTNRALEMATGEFIALMDHDDTITPDALYYMVKAVNDEPLADSVYSDEDKMDMEGSKLFEPHFKPDFNIDYLRNCNYICHMFMTRTGTARSVGGFRREYDGAQDFDFIFRCTEQSRRVVHVPRVLYHWRCHVNSTAAVPESKMYAYHAGVNSIKGHFERTGLNMEADMGPSFGYYKNSGVISGESKVSIIIHGSNELMEKARMAVASLTYSNIEIITCEDTARAVNGAVQNAQGEYILLLDARVNKISPDAVEQLLGYAQRGDVAAAAAKSFADDGRIYSTFLVMGIEHSFGFAFRQLDADNNGYFMRSIAPQDVSGVDLTCTIYKKSAWDETGGLDESMNLIYGSADLSLRLEKLNEKVTVPDTQVHMWRDSYKIVYVPYANASISASCEEKWHTDDEDAVFMAKWKDVLNQPDKYYNINLTKRDTNFAIVSSMELKNENL